jgi:hypothetical protein
VYKFEKDRLLGQRKLYQNGMKIDLNRMLDHLSEVSVFGRSAVALFLILSTSFALTLFHTPQEWKGRAGPLWRNFGGVVGVWVPDWFGFPLFFLILTVVLWPVTFVAVTGTLLTCAVPSQYTALALGALVGARVADTLVSHVLLYALRYRPNPGLTSTPLYVAEAVFVIATFSKGFTTGGGSTWMGFAIGAGVFCIVLPLLWSLRMVKPSWRRDRWRRGEPPSAWTGITKPEETEG